MVTNLFLLGAAKSGTTSLSNYLNQHPNICLADGKEPLFFELDEEFSKGESYYRDEYFSHQTNEKFLLNARHRNLYLPWIPERIKQFDKNPKFLVILRDPVERAFSHYCHLKRYGKEPLTFGEAIFKDYVRISAGYRHRTNKERKLYQQALKKPGHQRLGIYRTYIDSGYYAKQLKRYMDNFAEDDIKLIRFRDLIKNTESICEEIFEFLSVDSAVKIEYKTHNSGWMPRNVAVDRLLKFLTNRIPEVPFLANLPKNIISNLRFLLRKPKSDHRNELAFHWLYQHFKSHIKLLEQLTDRKYEDWSFDLESETETYRKKHPDNLGPFF